MAQTETTGTLAGYFDDYKDAQRAVEELRDAGFNSAQIGVAHRGPYSSNTGSTAGQKTEGAWDKFKNFFGLDSAEPYADERTKGDLANREVTPDPSYSGSSYSDTGYSGEDFHENLTGLSIPEDRSRYFSSRLNSSSNGAVVTVNAGSRTSEAESILTRCGADLGQNAASYQQNAASYQTSQTDTRTETAAQAGELQGTQNIQLLGEVLRVHKDRINRGDVRIRKEVITDTQSVQVPVTREELVVERHAVQGDTPAQGNIGESKEIRIPLTEETASLDKSTVVREEVSVGKKPVGQVRDLTGDVRREELVVEDETKDKSKKAVNE